MMDPIEQALADHGSNPWIVSSFGKDSLALIDLLAPYGVRNVLTMEDADETVDVEHIAEIRDRYNLNLYHMQRGRVLFRFLKNRPFFLAFPFISERHTVVMPTFTPPYEDAGTYICVDAELHAFRGTPLPFTPSIVFTGQKAADIGSKGCLELLEILPPAAAAARRDAEMQAGIIVEVEGLVLCRPIIHWTDNDVWEYLEKNNIRVSPKVYRADHSKRPVDRTWCYRCHDPGQPSIVACPRSGSSVLNLAAMGHSEHGAIEELAQLGILNDAEAGELYGR